MATFNETPTGGARAEGSALASQNVASANFPIGQGGLYGAGTASFSGVQGSAKDAFVARFSKGGAAFIKMPDGSRKRVKIIDYVFDAWSDGRYQTDGGVDLIYNGTDMNPTEYLISLNIIYDIGTKELYGRYLNSVS